MKADAPEIFRYIAEKSGKPIALNDPYPDAREVK